jgi:hypothetical protein
MRANDLCNTEAGKALSQMLAVNTVLTELDVSNNIRFGARDGPGFAQELSSGIRDNGALSIANVMGNIIGKEMLFELQVILRSKPNLISLCGIADDATEVDLSYLDMMDADDAIILASELPDKRAILSLNLSNSNIAVMQNRLKLAGAKKGQVVTFEGISWTASEDANAEDEFAVTAFPLADAISDMGALTLLNLANNRLCGTWIDAFGESQGTFDSSGMFSARFFQ